MKPCPDAGATLEETRSSSEQVTVETVSYSVCEGPGSLLKFGGSIHGPVTLQRHTAGPWRLCSQSVVLTSANTNMFLFRTHHSLVHSLRIQFGGSHVCSRSLTLCVRVQVHYWSWKDDPWTSHSSETHSWTLETLLCSPLPPHNHSSSVWEEKHCHWLWAQTHKYQPSYTVSLLSR